MQKWSKNTATQLKISWLKCTKRVVIQKIKGYSRNWWDMPAVNHKLIKFYILQK